MLPWTPDYKWEVADFIYYVENELDVVSSSRYVTVKMIGSINIFNWKSQAYFSFKIRWCYSGYNILTFINYFTGYCQSASLLILYLCGVQFINWLKVDAIKNSKISSLMTNPDNVKSYIKKSYAITVYDSLNKNSRARAVDFYR